MYERYTDRARRVVILSQDEARMQGRDQIGTIHLLAAMLAEGEAVAAQALTALGVTLEAVRKQAGEPVPAGSPPNIPFTPRAKRVLELALREALQLGHNYVGTEHILLGVAREGAASALNALSISPEDVRAKVLELLGGYEKAERAEPAAPPDVRSDAEMTRVGEAFLAVHQLTCERCATLALLCPGCRQAFGECIVRGQIERLLVAGEVPADGT